MSSTVKLILTYRTEPNDNFEGYRRFYALSGTSIIFGFGVATEEMGTAVYATIQMTPIVETSVAETVLTVASTSDLNMPYFEAHTIDL